MITVADEAIRPTVRALVRSGNNLSSLFCFHDGDTWRPLHSHEVTGHRRVRRRPLHRQSSVPGRQGVRPLPEPGSSPTRAAARAIAATPGAATGWVTSDPRTQVYIDPLLISRYESDGQLPAIPAVPAALPAAAQAEVAVAALLAAQD